MIKGLGMDDLSGEREGQGAAGLSSHLARVISTCRVVPSCFPSPPRTEKKEEINDVQLEPLVRYEGELPGWECGQVRGWVS